MSDESGRFEVHDRPFPESGRRVQISASGGRRPVWAPDGTRLYLGRRSYDQAEVTVRVFERGTMVECTRIDQEVGRWNGHASRAAVTRALAGVAPRRGSDWQLGDETFKLAKDLLLTIALCAVPQLEPHDWTPACDTGFERRGHAGSHRGVPIGAQEVNPGGRIDQYHGSALLSATCTLQLLDRHQARTGSGALRQLRHSSAPVEFGDCRDDRFAFRGRPGEAHGIRELAIRNTPEESSAS